MGKSAVQKSQGQAGRPFSTSRHHEDETQGVQVVLSLLPQAWALLSLSHRLPAIAWSIASKSCCTLGSLWRLRETLKSGSPTNWLILNFWAQGPDVFDFCRALGGLALPDWDLWNPEAVVTPCRTQDLLGEGRGLGFGHLSWRPEPQ